MDLASRCGSHQNDFIFLIQACIHTVQIPDMRTVHKDIKVFSQIAFRVHKMESNRRVFLDYLLYQIP